MATKYKVGYVDENINQLKLYRRRLKDFGFEVIGYEFTKGMSIEELMEQIYASDIDLLIIDFRLNESNIVSFNGDQVERHIYEKKPLFPHIIFTNKVDQAQPEVDDLKIIIDKENVFSSEEENGSRADYFVSLLTKSIEQYRTYVNNKKTIIAQLIEKETKEELSAKDKDLLLSLQRELFNLDKTRLKEIPEQLKSTEKLDKLSQARQEAEAYIKSLLENNDESKK